VTKDFDPPDNIGDGEFTAEYSPSAAQVATITSTGEVANVEIIPGQPRVFERKVCFTATGI
jgi:hypothetical protein